MRSITPVVAVVVLLLMTVSAAGMAFLTITSYQSQAQSGSESGIEKLSASTQSQIKVESISGGLLYLRSLGNNCEALIVQVGTEPPQLLGDCNSSMQVFNITSSCTSGYQTVKVISGNNQIVQSVLCSELGSQAEQESQESTTLSMPWPLARHDTRNTGYFPTATNISQPGVFEKVNFIFMGSPALAGDLDGDDKVEVVLGGQLTVLYGENLTIKWENTSIPVTQIGVGQQDGVSEIFTTFTAVSGTVYDRYGFYGSNGTTKWSDSEGMRSQPIVIDVDQDGNQEVVFSSASNNITAIDTESGDVVWTYDVPDNEFVPSLAVDDLENDGINEVVFGSIGSRIYVLYGNNGTQKWNYTFSDMVYASPSLADLDEDGNLEIIIGSLDHNLYSLYANGSQMWSYDSGYEIHRGTAVADINNDDDLEVVFVTETTDNSIYALSSNGTKMWNYTQAGAYLLSDPVIGDVDGNGIMDVIYTTNDIATTKCVNLTILYGSNGTKQLDEELGCTGSPCTAPTIAPSLADIDLDGVIEILASSGINCPS